MVQLRKSRKSFRKTRGRKTRQRKNEKRKSRKTRSTRKTGGDWKDWRWNKGSEKIKQKVKEWVELIITDEGKLINDAEMESKMGKIDEIINFLNNDKGFHGISRSSCGENQWCQREKMIYYSIAVHLFLCLPTNIQKEKAKDLDGLNAKFSKFRDGYINDKIFLETFWEFRRSKTPEERRDLDYFFEWVTKKKDIVKYFTYIHSFEYLRREERVRDKFSIFKVFLSEGQPGDSEQYENFKQEQDEWTNWKEAVEVQAPEDIDLANSLLLSIRSKIRRKQKNTSTDETRTNEAKKILRDLEVDKKEVGEALQYAKNYLKNKEIHWEKGEKYENPQANYLERERERERERVRERVRVRVREEREERERERERRESESMERMDR